MRRIAIFAAGLIVGAGLFVIWALIDAEMRREEDSQIERG